MCLISHWPCTHASVRGGVQLSCWQHTEQWVHSSLACPSPRMRLLSNEQLNGPNKDCLYARETSQTVSFTTQRGNAACAGGRTGLPSVGKFSVFEIRTKTGPRGMSCGCCERCSRELSALSLLSSRVSLLPPLDCVSFFFPTPVPYNPPNRRLSFGGGCGPMVLDNCVGYPNGQRHREETMRSGLPPLPASLNFTQSITHSLHSTACHKLIVKH